ncbi:hypothetical protein GRZ55_22585 [Chelativorans sp. ZYF759]|uniref:hypothetical protein n=1 Tax=Chelativorans sp. ZYF759 TaxID=2692213 RepID=UPI00145FBB5C|nr:hypothetical protein [Chelativorans sp. ZYF759]NMG42018.1 hypothetical protein [Chelativorans sp. ZYF759]
MPDVANMLQFHALGLKRVSRIIDGNPNYDDLMEHRLGESHWEAFENEIDIKEKRSHAVTLFEKKFRGRRFKTIVPEFANFACHGSTPNNLREFSFFERICHPVGVKILNSNYSYSERISASKLDHEQKEALEKIADEVKAFYKSRFDVTASIVHQQILYSRSFFNFLLAFSQDGAARPAALVQANDHSPAQVALSMVLKGLGVPRIYLQHAEVTESFPELDFDYSVLRNKQSRQIYEAIGPAAGRVFVIPRHSEAFSKEALFKQRGSGLTVVVYPTSRVLSDRAKLVADALRRNPAVDKIVIKQHPAAADRTLDQVLGASGVTFADKIPDEDHIAVVGNSSVVIELLHRGIPVYQNFDFDPVSADYYGFVKSGLTFEVTLAELSEMFWRPYPPSECWLEAYAQRDPSATPDYLKEQEEFVSAMARLAAASNPAPASNNPIRGKLRARVKSWAKRAIVSTINASPALSGRAANLILAITELVGSFLLVNTHNAARFFQLYTNMKINSPVLKGPKRTRRAVPSPTPDLLELLEYTLSSAEQPGEWLQLNEKTGVFSSFAVISAMETMLQNRNPAVNTIFHAFPEWPSGSAVGTWIYLKKLEWGNIEIAELELEAIAAFVYKYSDDAQVRANLERLLLLGIISCGTLEQLDHFWLGAKLRHESLSIDRKIDVLRRLRGAPERQAEAERMRQELKDRATPFELLKLRNLDFLEGRPVPGWAHVHVERQFMLTAPRGIARDFTAYVRPAYDALRPRMRFMEARANAGQAEALLSLVRAALEDAKPFSLIRLSDGEGYLFPEGPFFDLADSANRERHWWGAELPEDLRLRIVAEARQAVAEADVVGIPAVYRFIRDCGDHSAAISQSLQGRGLLNVLSCISELISSTALASEDKVNIALFKDVEAVARLAASARKVIVVSSARTENLPSGLAAGRRINTVTIPTHHKTALNEKYHNGSQPLPFVYLSLLQELEELASPGDLVLVAGGVIGKIFIGRARARGAVALDIGHVLDDWMHSRLPSLR